MTRRIFGILFCISFILFGIWSSSDWWWIFNGDSKDVIVIEGFGTVWAGIAGILMCGTWLVFLLCFSMKVVDKNINIIVIVTAFILSPLISVVVLQIINNKSSGFTECVELKRSSSFHSSKTYAITPQVCQRLVSDRLAREL
jgi:hypothetical protein